MKKLAFLLVGLLLLPSISFAQTTVSRETILTEIAQLQAELNTLEMQVSTSTTTFIMPQPPVMEVAPTSTPVTTGCVVDTSYHDRIGRHGLMCGG